MRASGSTDTLLSEIAKLIEGSSNKNSKNATSTGNNTDLRDSLASTIVYAPTRAMVESVHQKLMALLGNGAVEAYHAGLNPVVRDAVHRRFLTGQTPVIVATVAFGMGINKPDIRMVIHVAGCKTMEEYYQQVGRAGRDGLPAKCIMFATNRDLNKYRAEFYTKGLQTPQQKQSYLASVEQMVLYSNAPVTVCRREFIKVYFGEASSSLCKINCGTCDNCLQAKSLPAGDAAKRDFTLDAKVILTAIRASHGKLGWSRIKEIINGSSKYSWHADTMKHISNMRVQGPRRFLTYYETLMQPLIAEGYVKQVQEVYTSGASGCSYAAYVILDRAQNVLNGLEKVMLLPPKAMFEQEYEQKRKREERIGKLRVDLRNIGVDRSMVPPTEWAEGKGPVIDTYVFWFRTCATRGVEFTTWRTDLLNRIRGWRSEVASKLGMAPANILAEHLIVKIAYSVPSQLESLYEIGARVATAELLSTLDGWRKEYAATKSSLGKHDRGENDPGSGSARMTFSPGLVQGKRWGLAQDSKRTPAWLDSFERFNRGEGLEAIATNRSRPVQPATVAGHVLTAMTFGHAACLSRVVEQMPNAFPNRVETERLERAFKAANVDPLKQSKFVEKDILQHLVEHDVNVDFKVKPDKHKQDEYLWYTLIRTICTLKRAGIPLVFESGKVQKV